MKKTFALLVGEDVIEKSHLRSDLIPKRESLKAAGKKAYICTFVGRVQIGQDDSITTDDEIVEEETISPAMYLSRM